MDYDSVSENDGDEVTGDQIIVINDEGDQAGNDDPEGIIIVDEGDPAVIFVSGNGDPRALLKTNIMMEATESTLDSKASLQLYFQVEILYASF